MFLLGNCYQGLVTSFMLKPVQQKILKSIDELLESDYNIEYTSIHLIEALINKKAFENVIKENRLIDLSSLPFDDFSENIRTETATGQRCKFYRNAISKTWSRKSIFGMYLIDEVIFREPEKLFTGFLNPFYDKFQEIMDRSFEAGLTKAWELYFFLYFRYDHEAPEIEKKILDFESIAPFFLILVFGLSVAGFVLLVEIFYNDVLKNISKEFVDKKIKQLLRKMRK